ncbi:hypothetical protein MMPV_000778 [Pyropia vietnamensis]
MTPGIQTPTGASAGTTSAPAVTVTTDAATAAAVDAAAAAAIGEAPPPCDCRPPSLSRSSPPPLQSLLPPTDSAPAAGATKPLSPSPPREVGEDDPAGRDNPAGEDNAVAGWGRASPPRAPLRPPSPRPARLDEVSLPAAGVATDTGDTSSGCASAGAGGGSDKGAVAAAAAAAVDTDGSWTSGGGGSAPARVVGGRADQGALGEAVSATAAAGAGAAASSPKLPGAGAVTPAESVAPTEVAAIEAAIGTTATTADIVSAAAAAAGATATDVDAANAADTADVAASAAAFPAGAGSTTTGPSAPAGASGDCSCSGGGSGSGSSSGSGSGATTPSTEAGGLPGTVTESTATSLPLLPTPLDVPSSPAGHATSFSARSRLRRLFFGRTSATPLPPQSALTRGRLLSSASAPSLYDAAGMGTVVVASAAAASAWPARGRSTALWGSPLPPSPWTPPPGGEGGPSGSSGDGRRWSGAAASVGRRRSRLARRLAFLPTSFTPPPPAMPSMPSRTEPAPPADDGGHPLRSEISMARLPLPSSSDQSMASRFLRLGDVRAGRRPLPTSDASVAALMQASDEARALAAHDEAMRQAAAASAAADLTRRRAIVRGGEASAAAAAVSGPGREVRDYADVVSLMNAAFTREVAAATRSARRRPAAPEGYDLVRDGPLFLRRRGGAGGSAGGRGATEEEIGRLVGGTLGRGFGAVAIMVDALLRQQRQQRIAAAAARSTRLLGGGPGELEEDGDDSARQGGNREVDGDALASSEVEGAGPAEGSTINVSDRAGGGGGSVDGVMADEDGVVLPMAVAARRVGGDASGSALLGESADGLHGRGGLISLGGGRMECSICLDVYAGGEGVTMLGCLHMFHTGCVVPWLRTNVRCPLCKTSIRDRRLGGGGG